MLNLNMDWNYGPGCNWIVILIKEGRRPRQMVKMTMERRWTTSFGKLLREFGRKLNLKSGYVKKIYSLDGQQICDMAEFFKRQHIFIVSENNEVLPREFVIDDDEEKFIAAALSSNRVFPAVSQSNGDLAPSIVRTNSNNTSRTILPDIVDLNTNNNLNMSNNAEKKGATQVPSCLSKKSLQIDKKLRHVKGVEVKLKQHPLALYHHFEECLPAELFRDVIDILDPEMRFALDDEDYVDPERLDDGSKVYEFKPELYGIEEDDEGSVSEKGHEEPKAKMSEKGHEEPKAKIPTEPKVRTSTNPYRWILKIDERLKKNKKGKREQKKPNEKDTIRLLLNQEDEDTQLTVTQEFCNWVENLGGDDNNIDEFSIGKMFETGFEKKPPLTVPIEPVGLSSVPQELRSVNANQRRSALELNKLENIIDSELLERAKPVKYVYGAWYLPVEFWKRRPSKEPLQSPLNFKEQEYSDTRTKSFHFDYDLAQLNGTKMFMEYIKRIGRRRPEFIDHVAQIQEEKLAEEMKMRLLMEKKKQNKRSKSSKK